MLRDPFLPTAPRPGASYGAPQTITGTGGASGANSTALEAGRMATLQVGAAAICFRMGSTTPTAVTTDVYLPAGGRFDWYVESDSVYVAIIDPDGSATVTAHVWQSSPSS